MSKTVSYATISCKYGASATVSGVTNNEDVERGRATDRPGDQSPFAIGLLMRRAHDRAASALVQALRPLGLELRHFAVLIALNEHGTLSQRDLVAVVGSEKTSMVRVIDDLEATGLVVRRAVPGDRRMHAVEMTAEGLAAFDAAHVSARDIAAGLVAHLRPGEAERLMDLLTRFTYPPTGEN
jgi:DNA-binding MarR family transcriptional regulator